MTRCSGKICSTAVIVLPLLVAGCATFVTSGPADKGSSGIEYVLCLPTLVAEPQPDGRITFTKTCLPDPERRYVINGATFLGNLTLNVERNQDMTLKKVTIDANDSAIAVEAAKAAGAITQKRFEVKAAAEKEKATAKKTALDAATKTAEDAEKVLEIAEANANKTTNELRRERSRLKSLLAIHGFPDRQPKRIFADTKVPLETKNTILNALQAVQEREHADELAKDARTKAETAVEEARTELGRTASSGNVPSPDTPPVQQVWGPVVYRLQQSVDKDGELLDVRLVALFDQPQFETVTLTPKIHASIGDIDYDKENKIYAFPMTFSTKVDEIAEDTTFLQNAETLDRIKPTEATGMKDNRGILIRVGSEVRAGTYRVAVNVKVGNKTHQLRATVTLAPEEDSG